MQLIYYITPPEEFCGVVVDFLDVSSGHKKDTPTTPGFIDKKNRILSLHTSLSEIEKLTKVVVLTPCSGPWQWQQPITA